MVELLRAIGRGNDPHRRINKQLTDILVLLEKAKVDVDVVIQCLLSEIRSELTVAEMSARSADDADREIEHILIARAVHILIESEGIPLELGL